MKVGFRRIAALLGLIALASTSVVLAQVGYSQRAKEVGTHLKCMCKGCDMSAGLCAHPGGAFSGPCDTAKSELKEVDDLLGKGKTEQQIIDAFVAEYGTVIYMEPPKKGFGLIAWLMPVFYTVIGLGLLVFVVKKWAVRAPGAGVHATSASGGAAAMAAANPAMERARAQAARETED
jgi:cytochrome c-type biogenesis protein CcmH